MCKSIPQNLMIKNSHIVIVGLLLLAMGFYSLFKEKGFQLPIGGNTNETVQSDVHKEVDLLSNITQSASPTSTAFRLAGAKRATFFFSQGLNGAAAGRGTTTFQIWIGSDVTVTNDDAFIVYNKLISNVTNTNAQTLTRVASVALDSTATSTVSMDLESDSYPILKCVASSTAAVNVSPATTLRSNCRIIVDY